jgi:hypothetical protein
MTFSRLCMYTPWCEMIECWAGRERREERGDLSVRGCGDAGGDSGLVG